MVSIRKGKVIHITGLDRSSGLQDVQTSTISKQLAREGGKVSPAALTPRRYPA